MDSLTLSEKLKELEAKIIENYSHGIYFND